MPLQDLLGLTVKNKASDLHLLVGVPPSLRIDGNLMPIGSYPPLTPEVLAEMVYSILKPEQKEILTANKELDFSLGFGGGASGQLGRFRINIYYQRGNLAAAFRFLQPNIKTIDDLKLPKICHQFANLKQGLILVTGPTGHGKSTTLAAIINEINLNKTAHILTIEDPIEYVYPPGKSIISQREMAIDTHSWNNALRSSLREDPDVVMVGEMRDPETIASAITIAETGHLVFSTLHTNSAAQTIDRIIDSFPTDQQTQVKVQLASTLKGIISQRLIPQINGGRIVAVEILIGTNAIASNIRDGKTHLIDSVIQTSQDVGMLPLEASLASLVMSGAISLETAKGYALHPEELLRAVA
ncbi:MAG: twitching motility protein [Microgenomates group bacterium GW2011_GWC1_38_14]|nr:MAG: twitching motility protein [Candidatus Levybacteria bacterium GW2011_GWB1_36_18]KKQ57999.1 MAG: twitching motility protein [Microgenomates group bacterium GW2011_GWC1_38_14]KKR16285.1 MAG: twitching motility protein [Candidatus Levybacteria bacterium GW2011_GWA1_39_32]OGH44354.1 MAG: type IV pili twitching motility protein PilT [Candidatus Levybacteria bacterium RIFCSPLOWO2_02_FULL_37_11]HBB76973.1 type IV pili twitching motility protein PilT [Candidatus Levybacteria bacterium]